MVITETNTTEVTPTFPLYKAAESIVKRGGYVFFIEPGSKACTRTGWQNSATRDLNVIANWTDGNYGIIGKEDGLVVLDVDLEGMPVIAEYEKKFGPIKTLRSATPSGGNHLIFIQDEHSWALGNAGEKVPKDKGEGEVWSLRANNRYGVGPGSTINGKKYKVIEGSPCITMPKTLIEFLRARLVAAAIAEETKLNVSSPASSTTTEAAGTEAVTEIPSTKAKHTKEYWDAQINSADPVAEGGRNDFLTSIAGLLVTRGVKDEALYTMLSTVNERRLSPPLSEKEVLTISKSVSKYKKNKLDQLFARSKNPGLKPASEYTEDQFLGVIGLLAFSSSEIRQFCGLDVPVNGDLALQSAAKLIWDRIKIDATVFSAEGVGYLMFKGHEGKPIKIAPDDPLFADLMLKYNLMAPQKQFTLVGKYMGKRSEIEGTKTTIRRVSHYNAKTNCAYFAEGRGNLLKVSGSKIERVVNGTDGELFVFPEESDDFSVDLNNLPKIQNALMPAENSELHNVLFGGLNFVEIDFMTDEQKKILMTAYVLTLLLPDIISGRLILQMIGPSGSGKSFFLRLVGRIIVGKSFHVRNMPATVEQLQNQLVNDGIVFFDNLEHIMAALKPILCMASTGGEISLRQLFTTSGRQILKLIAAIGWSATAPILSVTEIMNRSLVIGIRERADNSNVGETFLLQQVDEKREAFVAELLVRVQAIIRANENHKNYNPKMSLRMADFGTLILRVAREEGWEEDAKILLDDWSQCQVSTSLQNDDISSALQKMIASPRWAPCEMTAAQVNSALTQGFTPGDTQRTSWKGGAMSLSQKLHRSSASYAKLFGMTISTRRNQAIFKFDPTPGVLAEIREAAAKEAEVRSSNYDAGSCNLIPRTLPNENEESEFQLE